MSKDQPTEPIKSVSQSDSSQQGGKSLLHGLVGKFLRYLPSFSLYLPFSKILHLTVEMVGDAKKIKGPARTPREVSWEKRMQRLESEQARKSDEQARKSEEMSKEISGVHQVLKDLAKGLLQDCKRKIVTAKPDKKASKVKKSTIELLER